MSRYIKSYYNYAYKVNDSDRYIITNLISRKIIKINELQKLFYDNTDIFDDDSDYVCSMVENGILIDEKVDESSYIKEKIKENVYDTSEVCFTICVTMRCNLSCIYCFEGIDKENIDMDIDTQDKIIEFIENKIKESKTKRLKIWWYGGEPLLRPDIISDMSKKILDIVDRYNLEYISRVVTNGTRLDQKMCDILEKANVKEAQITLDGATSDVHDKTRSYIGGKGSFDDIIYNLYNIKTNIFLQIIFIINKNNINEYNGLKMLIEDIRKKTGNNILLKPSRLDINDKNEIYVKDLMIDEEQILDYEEKNNNKLFTVCSAQKYYTYVIDAKGNIFKCQNCMRDNNYIIGNVRDVDINEKLDNKKASLDFINNKWLHPNDECKKCTYLPFCVGGCVLNFRKKLCKDYYKKYLDNMLSGMI